MSTDPTPTGTADAPAAAEPQAGAEEALAFACRVLEGDGLYDAVRKVRALAAGRFNDLVHIETRGGFWMRAGNEMSCAGLTTVDRDPGVWTRAEAEEITSYAIRHTDIPWGSQNPVLQPVKRPELSNGRR